jgi:hypothetical protein
VFNLLKESLFYIVVSGHLRKKAFYSRIERRKKKRCIHSYTVNCLSNGLSVDTGDESFFFFFSLLIWKNNLRTLRSCFIHQWLRSFIFVKLTERRKKKWTSFFLFFTVQTLTTNQNCLSLPINCPFYHIKIIKKAN